MGSSAGRPPRRRFRPWLLPAVLAGVLVAAPAAPAQPIEPGFTDGHWEGDIAWAVVVEFTDALGYGETSGRFSVTYQGGVPKGTFKYAAADVVGATDESRAELLITSSGDMSQTATGTPLLLPRSLSVAGEVLVYGVDRFPVEFTMGGGQDAIPLDIIRAGCTAVSGTFKTQAADMAAAVAAAGGSLSVQTAWWSARRVGDAGTSAPEQSETMAAVLEDGAAILAAIEDGTVDADALAFLVYRAEQIALAIERNTSCSIENPGLFMTEVAGLVTQILTKMVASDHLFNIRDFKSAVQAGLRSGAIGASAGAADDQLVLEIKNLLRERFAAAAAATNKQELTDIAAVASLIGDQELVDLAVAAAKAS